MADAKPTLPLEPPKTAKQQFGSDSGAPNSRPRADARVLIFLKHQTEPILAVLSSASGRIVAKRTLRLLQSLSASAFMRRSEFIIFQISSSFVPASE